VKNGKNEENGKDEKRGRVGRREKVVKGVVRGLWWFTWCALGWAENPVKVDILLSQDAVRPGDQFMMGVRFQIQPGYHIYSADARLEDGGYPTRIDLPRLPHVTFGPANWPPAVEKEIPALGRFRWYEHEVLVRYPVTLSRELPIQPLRLDLSVTYGACTDVMCRPFDHQKVSRSVKVVPPGAPVKTLHAAWFGVPSIAHSPSPPSSSSLSLKEGGPGRGQHDFGSVLSRGWVVALLLALGWGVLASLSPCVYPMIPITVAYFASQVGNSRKRTLGLAVCYVMGMVTMYAVLGWLAARAGRDIGAWMANPWVMGGLSVLLVAMSLSMFGLFEMTLPPSWVNTLQGGPSRGPLGALFMGLALGFVAAPCVGPFAASLLAFAATQANPWMGFWSLFAFGWGMGLLFLILALFAGAMSRWPRSGPWMVKIKEASGFLLLGVTLYFLSVFLSSAAVWMIGGALAVWAGLTFGAFRKSSEEETALKKLGHALWVLLVIAGGYGFVVGLDMASGRTTAGAGWVKTASSSPSWIYDMGEGLRLARQQGKPVMVDFYADWCLPCKKMDATVFKDPAVLKELERFVAIKVDCTRPDSPGAVLKNSRWREPSMPLYAFYAAPVPSWEEGGIPPPTKSVGYTDAKTFLEILRAIP